MRVVMPKIFLLLLFSFTLLQADIIEEYLQQRIQTEIKMNFNENNVSAMEKEEKVERQHFMPFFLDFIAQVNNKTLRPGHPYRSEMFKLNRRMKSNELLGNSYAVKRDALKLASLKLKQNIRDTLFKVIKIEFKSYPEFESKLQQIIIERHKDEPDIDLRAYSFVQKSKVLDAMSQSILDNLKEYIAIQDIHNDLSAILIEDAQSVYKGILLSSTGLLSLAWHIEESSVAKVLTPYLKPLHLSTSKVLFTIVVILLGLLFRSLVFFVFRKFFLWLGSSEDDTAYLIERTGRPFNILLTIIVLELIFLVLSSLSEVAWVFTLFKVSYVFAVTFLIYRFYNAIAVVKMEQIGQNKHVRNEVVNLGLKGLNVLTGLVALIFVLKILGVNLTALLSGLGIGGVAVAFAAKDTIANLFGSISILLSDLFEQGDWIAVDDMEGNVVEIGLRATTIRTFDNALIAIPNFRLADNGIKNWSRRKMGRRIKMTIGVTYESDMDDIKNALEEIRQMLHEHPLLMGEKTTYLSDERQLKLVSKEDLKGIKRQILVFLDTFDSSSINILVYCFSRSVVWNEWLEAKEDVMFKIAAILKANNLEFAYPTMMIHQAKEACEED